MAVDAARPPEVLARDEALQIEESRVTPVVGWPAKVVLELLLSNGTVLVGVMAPMQAHRLSDDLLRGAAFVKKDEQRPSEGV
jgi:hypothetical protein